MLQVKDISKKYVTGDLTQVALNHVSLNLRDNEFVAILGPSGSGKTTLLNVIGGLDRYDSGDLIINHISTKEYTDRDWDSYRNHTIGFVFQSYNLIPHQTVLANVEMALTISGVSRAQRRKRAVKALQEVGLGQQLHKRPNQMSGGQMQRVAIARALVNDPDILLADEPTGALDSETSIQVMDMLKQVAKDRLVVMVTHNPELAQQYATRIVRLKDGVILDDSDPFVPEEEALPPAEHKNMGKSSMSLLTSLGLSFNNLRTKKGRTILTAFAGSIGIIGIALILSVSNGVDAYINSLEADTLTDYPLTIYKSSGLDIMSLMEQNPGNGTGSDEEDAYEVKEDQTLKTIFSGTTVNDLKSFREYIESGKSDIYDQAKAIEYSYDVTPYIFRETEDGTYRQINPDDTFSTDSDVTFAGMSMSLTGDVFSEMPENANLYEDQYEVMDGRWPENYDECVLVLPAEGTVSDLLLYDVGLKDVSVLDQMVDAYKNDEEVVMDDETATYQYSDFTGMTMKLVDVGDLYTYDEDLGTYVNKSDDDSWLTEKAENGEDITIVGVVKLKDDEDTGLLSNGINYTHALTTHIMERAAESEAVKAQLADPDVNIFTGKDFNDEDTSIDMDSLFTIDEDALDLSTDSEDMDLSSAMGDMDLSAVMGNMDMSSLMSGVDLSSAAGDADVSSAMSEVDMSSLADSIDMTAVMNSVDMNAVMSSVDIASIVSNIDLSGLNIQVSNDALTDLFNSLLSGYCDELGSDGTPTTDGFTQYVNSSEGQQIIQNSSGNLVDTDSLETQVDQIVYAAVGSALQQAITPIAQTLSTQLAAALAEQMTPVMQQIMQQYMTTITENLTEQLTAQMTQVMQQSMTTMMQQMTTQLTAAMAEQMSDIMENVVTSLTDQLQSGLSDAVTGNVDSTSLEDLVQALGTSSSYENNLAKLNYADVDDPQSISIYPKDIDSKNAITKIIDQYNDQAEADGEDDKVINYTDTVASMTSMISRIVNTISYVLIAFVAVSLVVSSIMIGIITYISVLERTKEIGILRALGASKHNISQVFNAETFIIGLAAGLLGIGLAEILLFPINFAIHMVTDNYDVTAVLPVKGAILLVLLSVILTLIGGFIPSKKAAKKDPVSALRSE